LISSFCPVNLIRPRVLLPIAPDFPFFAQFRRIEPVHPNKCERPSRLGPCIPAMAKGDWHSNPQNCSCARRLVLRASPTLGEEPINFTEIGARAGEAALPPRTGTARLHELAHRLRRTIVFRIRRRARGMVRSAGGMPGVERNRSDEGSGPSLAGSGRGGRASADGEVTIRRSVREWGSIGIGTTAVDE
jgi:hypothetical protein